jgi:tetratricopeptide (TPR) repeat protein
MIRCEATKNLVACEDVIEMDPNQSAPFRILGNAELAQENYPEAIEFFTRALALAPEQPEVVASLDAATSARQRLLDSCLDGSSRSAIAACASARLSGAPDEHDLLIRWGDLLVSSTRTDEAYPIYEQARRIKPGIAGKRISILDSARACEAGGDKPALAACNVVIALAPDVPVFGEAGTAAYARKCRIQIELGTIETAAATCGIAAQRDPANAATFSRLVSDRAITECEQARSGTNPVSALEVCRNLRALPHNQQQLELLDDLIAQIESQLIPPDTNMPDPSELKSLCLAGDAETRDAAVGVCIRALLVNQGDADIQRVLVSYRASNAPLDLVAGEYGITY